MMFSRKLSFLDTIVKTIADFRMWEPGARILLAVSGGSDSMALLYSLLELQALHGAKFGVIHLNHALRPEADDEEDFVRNVSTSLNLSFFSRKVDLEKEWPELSTEEAGRMARYGFFEKILKKEGFHRIATAHHAGDQTEQILMNLIRGCGTDGLSGISAVKGNIVRPLLHVKKEDLLSYLSEKGIPFMEDASNADPRFLRNRIRHVLLPMLEKKFNPAIRKNLLHLGSMANEEKFFWENFSEKIFKDLLIETDSEHLKLSMEKLNALMPAVQARVLRKAIEKIKGDLLSLGKKHIEAVQVLLLQKESKIFHLPGRIRFSFSCGVLEIRKMPHSLRYREKSLQEFCKTIALPANFPKKIQLPEGFGTLLVHALDNTPEKNEILVPKEWFPLVVRNLRHGDKICLHNGAGPKKIFPFLGEMGIRYPERSKRPVLMREGSVVWAPGLPQAFIERPDSCTGLDVRIAWIPETSRKF